MKVALLALLLGCCLVAYALTMPYYTNQAAANRLLAKWGELGKKNYYAAEAKLRTSKTTLLDAGSGLVVAAALVLAFLHKTRTKCWADVARLRTPSAPVVLLYANAAWLLMLPGTWWYYAYRAGRGDYPPFADSIGIPIGAQTTFFLLALLPLNVLVAALLVKARLPARLLVWPARYTPRALVWEAIFGVLGGLVVLLTIAFVYDGDHVAIISFFALSYLVASLRAGHLGQLKNS